MVLHLTRRALIKWTLITWLCGGYSFFLGVAVTRGTYLPIILGMITLTLMFATIESHPKYQARRAGDPWLTRALDLGAKIRCFVAVFIIVLALISSVLNIHDWAWVLFLPQMLDVWIGVGTVHFTKIIFGFDISNTYAAVQPVGQAPQAPATFIYYLATYFTTITTGLAHTVILAVLCALIYGILRLKALGKSNVSP